MSEGDETPRQAIKNKSWLHSTPVRLAPRVLPLTSQNLERVCRNLESDLSNENNIELPPNVINEREFPFTSFDASIFPTNPSDSVQVTQNEPRRLRPYISRTPSRVSSRREFSLTSYDSEIFDPEEIYNSIKMAENTNADAIIPPAAIDAEISVLRRTLAQMGQNLDATSQPPSAIAPGETSQMLNIIQAIHAELHTINTRIDRIEATQARTYTHERQESDYEPRMTYGRTERDVRNRRSNARQFMSLKEARMMIPEFDGTSRHRLQEFLNACTYTMQNIHPDDEESLIQGILFTKLKGKAMQDFETRDIQTFAELKQQLETSYQSKQSTAHLQLEFNALKQKYNETAQSFGQRVDQLAMNLYNSMIEGENHASSAKRTILQTIQKQALLNFQLGLRNDLKILVRSQRYTTLQEAIAGASAEEKLIGPSTSRATNSSLYKSETTRQGQRTAEQCYRCGKFGHYGRDCRSKITVLPKPEKSSRVTAVEKFCTHCRKRGHNRDECWTLNGSPKTKTAGLDKQEDRKKPRSINKIDNQRIRQERDSDSERSSDEDGERGDKIRKTRALEYQVTHVRQTPRERTSLNIITLPMREAKHEKINMLYDSGATISLIKVKHLKGETEIYNDKITLVGITGHKAKTIGKMYANIELNGNKIKHAIYVVKDDFPMEYDGIIGLDFLQKQQVTCDYKRRELRIGNAVLKLQPYNKIILKPRSETIIQATTNRNEIGIVKAEETAPGIYIGRCLVEPKNFQCPVSVINTTDNAVEIRTPLVTVEDVSEDNVHEVYAIHTSETPNSLSRDKQI